MLPSAGLNFSTTAGRLKMDHCCSLQSVPIGHGAVAWLGVLDAYRRHVQSFEVACAHEKLICRCASMTCLSLFGPSIHFLHCQPGCHVTYHWSMLDSLQLLLRPCPSSLLSQLLWIGTSIMQLFDVPASKLLSLLHAIYT